MKTLFASIVTTAITVAQAQASGGGGDEGLSLLGTLFIAFGSLIVVFQFVPGILMFGGLLKGLFTLKEKKTHKA